MITNACGKELSYRVLQKKQPHRHQEVLLQHPLYPQLNVEVSYNGRPRLLKWLFFLKAVVYTRCAQHWVGGRGARTAPFDRVCVGGCFFWRTRTTSCDKELQTWHQWKKWRQGSGSHSANSAKGLWRLHCRACTAKSHPSAQALCRLRTLPSFAAGLRDCWPWWSGWLWQDIHLPCNTTCNTHATHMQHDMQHDTQHAGKVEKTQGFS